MMTQAKLRATGDPHINRDGSRLPGDTMTYLILGQGVCKKTGLINLIKCVSYAHTRVTKDDSTILFLALQWHQNPTTNMSSHYCISIHVPRWTQYTHTKVNLELSLRTVSPRLTLTFEAITYQSTG